MTEPTFEAQPTVPEPTMTERVLDQLTDEQRAQAERLQVSLGFSVALMVQRSEADPELMDALLHFTRSVENRAWFGESNQNLKPHQVRELTVFYEAAARRLHGEFPDGSHHTGWTILDIDETVRTAGESSQPRSRS